MIIDSVLPDMDGQDLAQKIKIGALSNAFIIIMSPIGSMVQRYASVSGWLSKPVKPLLLRNLLTNLQMPQKGELQLLIIVSSTQPRPQKTTFLPSSWQKITRLIKKLLLAC